MAGKRQILIPGLLIGIAVLAGCGSDTTGPGDSASIGEYITTLSYDAEGLLNVQPTGGSDVSRVEGDTETTSEKLPDGSTKVCQSTTVDLKQNFDQVAILRPTAGVIYPGALIKANQSMMDGVPEPVTLARAPMTLSIDLPGMGDNGVVAVSKPSNSSVQAAVDNALEWWNANAYQDGYVNASNSSYNYTSAFSSEQMAMDIGLNMSWATGDFQGKFSSFTSAQKTVVTASFRQAFYTVTFDTPEHPEDVFAGSVSLDAVKKQMHATAPPAYVSSVTYGRIIVFRMETSESITTIDLEAAFNYGVGKISAGGTLAAKYNGILQKSQVEVITIGGNAAVASQLIDPASLQAVITGENAVYSRSNPGVPIAYTVRYLKDDAVAKLGYTTQYTTKECGFADQEVTLTVDYIKAIKDCDGIEGIGEFDWAFKIYNAAGSTLISKSGSANVTDGGAFNGVPNPHVFKLPSTDGQNFKVTFWFSEWDKDILGNVYRDSRMNNRSTSFTHYFRDGVWQNTTRTAKVGVAGECEVEVKYHYTTRGV